LHIHFSIKQEENFFFFRFALTKELFNAKNNPWGQIWGALL